MRSELVPLPPPSTYDVIIGARDGGCTSSRARRRNPRSPRSTNRRREIEPVIGNESRLSVALREYGDARQTRCLLIDSPSLSGLKIWRAVAANEVVIRFSRVLRLKVSAKLWRTVERIGADLTPACR